MLWMVVDDKDQSVSEQIIKSARAGPNWIRVYGYSRTKILTQPSTRDKLKGKIATNCNSLQKIDRQVMQVMQRHTVNPIPVTQQAHVPLLQSS
jgi:hypothetical protein